MAANNVKDWPVFIWSCSFALSLWMIGQQEVCQYRKGLKLFSSLGIQRLKVMFVDKMQTNKARISWQGHRVARQETVSWTWPHDPFLCPAGMKGLSQPKVTVSDCTRMLKTEQFSLCVNIKWVLSKQVVWYEITEKILWLSEPSGKSCLDMLVQINLSSRWAETEDRRRKREEKETGREKM